MSGEIFAAVAAGLYAAHHVGDCWTQTHRQATHKGSPGWPGRLACAAHVATYTLTTAATVALLWWLFDLPISPLGFVAGQVASAVTHYWADRREPLEKLTQTWPFSRMGKHAFYRVGAPRDVRASVSKPALHLAGGTAGTTTAGRVVDVELRASDGQWAAWDNPSLGTGAYALDQSWHWFWLFVAALVTALV